MKSAGIIKVMVMGLAAFGLGLSGAAFAAPPVAKPIVHDVALQNGGVLAGQFVDAQNVAKAGNEVVLLREGRALVKVATDDRGNFAIRGLRGGVYQLAAAGEVKDYRLWAPGTAPKGVPNVALVVDGDSLVRGQCYGYRQGIMPNLPPARCLLANPWVVAGIVSTAVAVPVGISAADSADVPASP